MSARRRRKILARISLAINCALFVFSLSASQQISNAKLDATVGAIRALIRDGNVPGALEGLAAMEKQYSNDPEAKFAVGEIFQELAALRAEQLQRLAPDSSAAHELAGKSLEAQGKLDEAVAEYRRAVDKGAQTPGLHFLLGNVEWKRRNLEAAQSELQKELELNPHHATANLRMGEIALTTERDEPTRAVDFLREAVAGAPASLEAHRELGKALRLAHQFVEAERELELVAAKAPHDDTVHAQLAALYKETGDQERARREIEIHGQILRERREASQAVHSGEMPRF